LRGSSTGAEKFFSPLSMNRDPEMATYKMSEVGFFGAQKNLFLKII